jgi:hypothetical protein
MRRIGYRVGQFLRDVTARFRPLGPADWAEVRVYLPESAWLLFAALPRADQRHSLRVLTSLKSGSSASGAAKAEPLPATGSEYLALCQAALLHDCAKSEGVRLWHRVAGVLLKALVPALVQKWAAMSPPSRRDWRHPFWAYLNHPARGAELAAAAGCDPLAAVLIARHQDRQPAGNDRRWMDLLLAALQAADDDN